MNKRLKILLSLLAVVVVIAFLYFVVMNPGASLPYGMSTTTPYAATSSAATAKAKATYGTAKPASSGTTQTGGITVTPPVTLWSFVDRSNPRNTSQLYTAVTLTAGDNQYDLGTVAGVCKTINDTDLKGSGEISGIQCLTAGKGEEIGVFRQGSAFVVKQALIENGEAGQPDKRGTFTLVQTLK